MSPAGFGPARGLAALAALATVGAAIGAAVGYQGAAILALAYAALCLYGAHVQADRVRKHRRRIRTIRNLGTVTGIGRYPR